MQLFNVERSNSLWYSHTAVYSVGIKNKQQQNKEYLPYSIVLKKILKMYAYLGWEEEGWIGTEDFLGQWHHSVMILLI